MNFVVQFDVQIVHGRTLGDEGQSKDEVITEKDPNVNELTSNDTQQPSFYCEKNNFVEV